MKCPCCENELQLRINVDRLNPLNIETNTKNIILPNPLPELSDVPMHVNCVRQFNLFKSEPKEGYYDLKHRHR